MAQVKHLPIKTINPLDFFIERGGKVIENENGWLNYYVDGNVAYLENMYIYPNKRKLQNGTSLLSQLEIALKELHSCKFMFTTINRVIGKENVDKTLLICLKRGFEFSSADAGAIFLKKEI